MKSLSGDKIVTLTEELCALNYLKMPEYLLISDSSYEARDLAEKVVFKPITASKLEEAVSQLISC